MEIKDLGDNFQVTAKSMVFNSWKKKALREKLGTEFSSEYNDKWILIK